MHDLRDRLRELNADIVFLQEVQGENSRCRERFVNYPEGEHHAFLADTCWPHFAYGKNAVYASGHHGNAILSRYPIIRTHNTDISAHRFESRGLLHCEIALPDGQRVHGLCAHFGLFSQGRRVQTATLIDYVKNEIPAGASVIIAGDFNDWRNNMTASMSDKVGMDEVFYTHGGQLARSFPARLPMFRLDRIYLRGFRVLKTKVHTGGLWKRLSDHAALSATLESQCLNAIR